MIQQLRAVALFYSGQAIYWMVYPETTAIQSLGLPSPYVSIFRNFFRNQVAWRYKILILF
jgi:hypothetical protein